MERNGEAGGVMEKRLKSLSIKSLFFFHDLYYLLGISEQIKKSVCFKVIFMKYLQ